MKCDPKKKAIHQSLFVSEESILSINNGARRLYVYGGRVKSVRSKC